MQKFAVERGALLPTREGYTTGLGATGEWVYLASDVDELLKEIEQLKVALCFWMPSAPNNDVEINERVYKDCWLLSGMEADAAKSAEDLGWIRLRNSP